KEAVANGVRIVNIDTNLRVAFKKALWKSMSHEKSMVDPRAILRPSTEAMQAEVERIIKILGSANKA
ncbi:MAG: fructose-bisphosphate aldolase, class, partial [Patescibacteria group bacterium]|nr:fructose-bisphosphate aldolase, class [Patescibacteria group bacterium]